jgi:mevalonate kinase
MVTASAPGTVILLGEHAVVYGEPAVACAIERRASVTAERAADGDLTIHAADLTLDGFTVEYEGGTDGRPDVEVPSNLLEAGMGYFEEAVAQAREAAGAPDAGVEITVESSIPLGAGLGSSAAVTAATIEAVSRELGVELDAREVADRAYRVENTVQDGNASRTDTFCSAVGGAVRIEGDDTRVLDGVSDLPLVVGYDGGAGDTGQLVAGVRDLREEYGFAADTVIAIGDLVRRGETALVDADFEELGRLMDVNHGLLSALRVSARSLDAMVWAAREAGARGAKLTGAGGGGSIVALDETDASTTALRYTPGCEQAFRAELDTVGVRVERDVR